MSDLELLIVGAMVSFLSVAGAYIAIRHRANETPVDSFKPSDAESATPAAVRPQMEPR